ncbi:MAG: carboxypeptidase regulatory-like domain-containing protein [Caulobacterales bacterium]|nr:carboxypeptidase regulatory-like domain-containing protein [Caulobacterales bacterium]
MTRHAAPLAAVLALASILLIAPASADIGEPIPGIDIVVRKNPGGLAVVAATSGRDGRFSARVQLEPGEYQVSTACRARTACPAHELSSLTVDGRPARRVEDPPMQTRGDRNGIGIYIIGAIVMRERPPVVIAGQVATRRIAQPADPRDLARGLPYATSGHGAATRE